MSPSLSNPPLSSRPTIRRPRTGWFWFVLLGILQILLGAFAWIDVVVATIAGTVVIGAVLVVSGVLQMLHSFLDRRWRAFFLHFLSGILYAVAGFLIMAEPVQGALVLTIVLAAMLIVGGVFRVALSVSHWHLAGAALLLIGGLVSIGVGVGLYLMLPWSGLWVVGTLIAVELILHGAAWLEFGLGLRRLGRV
jgi:uncharacterized membrane protein HdeD (DUF308 family)